MEASLEETMTAGASLGTAIEETEEDTETGRERARGRGRGRLPKRDLGSTWLRGANQQGRPRLGTALPVGRAVFLEEPSLWIL